MYELPGFLAPTSKHDSVVSIGWSLETLIFLLEPPNFSNFPSTEM